MAGDRPPSAGARAYISLRLEPVFEHFRTWANIQQWRAVLKRDLLWLLDRDPAALDADQREVREYVAQTINHGEWLCQNKLPRSVFQPISNFQFACSPECETGKSVQRDDRARHEAALIVEVGLQAPARFRPRQS